VFAILSATASAKADMSKNRGDYTHPTTLCPAKLSPSDNRCGNAGAYVLLSYQQAGRNNAEYESI
jgi:hypothetical protein